jgi:dinuclear metal center YbgI/SA1388 family protein
MSSEPVPPAHDAAAHPVAADPLAAWLDVLHGLYPPHHAEGWDAVGLQVGDAAADTVTGVLVALDVTQAVLDEAVQRGCDLLVAHHPLLLSPLPRLTGDSAAGRLALLAARAHVAVVAAHTNLDAARPGTSHPVAEALDLRDVAPLQPLEGDPRVKLVTFVPRDDTAEVQAALAAAGAGVIGGYDSCGFRAPGTGRFRPGPSTDPHIGVQGQVTEVEEDRVEVVLPRGLLQVVLAALRAAHPYEEVPVDVYPLVEHDASPLGLGLVGDLPVPTPAEALGPRLVHALATPHVRVAVPVLDRPVTRVAVVGGAGMGLVDAARRAGAEVLVTGDVSHHRALDAMAMGLSVVDAGHWATEWPAMRTLADALAAAAPMAGLQAPVHLSALRTDPWTTEVAT